ncbi:MAG TPA: FCD domain-containing protein [Candidatus Dormibacteraeota bacterium]|nr:FCD domain-containing protein [Candidatus Dormibacteraeota bacterium]
MRAQPTRGTRVPRQLRQPRLAELVAAELRERITSGMLRDGDALPKLEELLEEFQVSKPSLREALRILETEGLITVRRGNVGGATIHAPGHQDAGYMIGLVLESRNVTVEDLARAIRRVEPICAALCAERTDRRRTVLPELRAIQEEMRRRRDDDLAFSDLGRRFHEALVALCGNETMKVIVGALEAVWSACEREWARRASSTHSFPPAETRAAGLHAHERLLERIEQGDPLGAARVAERHLERSTLYAVGDATQTVSAAAVRSGRPQPPRRRLGASVEAGGPDG